MNASDLIAAKPKNESITTALQALDLFSLNVQHNLLTKIGVPLMGDDIDSQIYDKTVDAYVPIKRPPYQDERLLPRIRWAEERLQALNTLTTEIP